MNSGRVTQKFICQMKRTLSSVPDSPSVGWKKVTKSKLKKRLPGYDWIDHDYPYDIGDLQF